MTPSYEEQFGPLRRRILRVLRWFRWHLKGLRGLERHLLVELNWRLGDEIMALPVFEALHQRYPQAHIHVLSNYPVLFKDHPHVHASEAPPVLVDRYVLLRGASRFQNRLAAYSATLGMPCPDNTLPALFFSDWTLPTHLRIPPGKGPLIALAPGASWPSKRWARAHWKALGDPLTRQGCRLVVMGQAGEGLPCGWDLTGQTTVDEAARVLHAADLVIACDSGLMHLARAAGTPVIGLFGPTDPDMLIKDDPDFTPIRSTAPCSGFWNHAKTVGAPGVCPEGHESCLESISPAQVLELVEQRLALTPRP
mgnify:CR=1 FL=1